MRPSSLQGGPAPRWRVRLLGGFELSDGRQRHTRLPTRAMTGLLARLALWPSRDHPREELVELIWPGVSAATGRGRLRQTLSLLRAVLEPAGEGDAAVLHADRFNIRLLPGRLECDALSFETAVRRGDPQAALFLDAGELLPGFYDEWVLTERARFQALRDRLVAGPAAAPSVAVRASPAPGAGGASGTPAGHPGWRAPVSRTPVYLTRCFGHEAQVDALHEMLARHRLVVLIGPGGSGKTRLAAELVRLVADGRAATHPGEPGPPLFVRLVSARSRAQVLAAIGAELRIDTPNVELDMVVQRLADAPGLVVLDNVEQFEAGAERLVEDLLAAVPGTRWLLTSRRSFAIDGEQLFPIAALPLPARSAPLAETAANPAVALFVDRARAVRSGFHLGARNVDAIAGLVGALEGMPLAIELAAARVRSFSPADMLVRLGAPDTRTDAAAHPTPQLDLLTRVHRRDDQRHASMVRTVAWSWELLDAQQRAMVGAMSVFVGGCSVAMIAAVHGTAADVHAGVESLLMHSIVRSTGVAPADGGDTLRFQLYEPIREFAATRADPAERARWRARHRAWALAWARALPTTPSLDEVRAELPNLAAAFDSAVSDRAADEGAALLVKLARSFVDVGMPSAALTQAVAVVDACGDPALRARARSAIAPLLFEAGRRDEALRQAAAGLAEVPDEPAWRGHALYIDALLRWRSDLQDFERVRPAIEEAEALARRCADPYLQAGLRSLRAFGVGQQPDGAEAALALYHEALAFWLADGNRHTVNIGRYNLAIGEFRCGRADLALQQLDLVMAEAQQLNDSRRLQQVACARGNVLEHLRRWPEALAAGRESLRLAWAVMAVNSLAFALWNIPSSLLRTGDIGAALTLARFAADFWRRHVAPLSEADARHVRHFERVAARCLLPADRAAAVLRGQRLTLAQAVGLALGEPAPAA